MQPGGTMDDLKVLIAVATKGEGRVNAHFGHVSEFQIFEVSATGVFFVGRSSVQSYCHGGHGDEEGLPSLILAIGDCHAALVAKIGLCPRRELCHAGTERVDQYAHESIEKAALAWFADYRGHIANGVIVNGARGDAVIRRTR